MLAMRLIYATKQTYLEMGFNALLELDSFASSSEYGCGKDSQSYWQPWYIRA